MYTYTLVKDAVKNKDCMLYIDTNFFFVQIFVQDIFNIIMNRSLLRFTFDIRDVFDDYQTGLYSIINVKEESYFKDKCNCHPSVEFVRLRPKMYWCTVNDSKKYESRLPVETVQLRH